MDISLAEVFYALGIIVAVLNILFLIAVGIGAWYAYKLYVTAKSKVMNNSALFMAKKIITNPLKVSSGMIAVQMISKLIQVFRSKRTKVRSSF